MRLLLVGAGAAFSTLDVETGYRHAFEEAGADVRFYALGARLDAALGWLYQVWRRRGKPADSRPAWPDAIYRGSVEALELALRFEVDWVLIISGMFFHPDVLELMRRAGLRTAVILTESPYEDAKQAAFVNLVDLCWTNERTSVETLRLANPRVRYLPAAYDPTRHAALATVPSDVPAHDVVFVGSGFAERIEVLQDVDWSGIDLGLYGEWGLLNSRSKLRQFLRSGPVANDKTVALNRAAKVGLNLHRSSMGYGRGAPRIEHAESMNPRTYELAACRCFQISDRRAEVQETFGGSVPTFSNPRELSALMRIYLAAPAQRRRELASAARQHVLPHTFAARAAQVLADLEACSSTVAQAKGA